MRSRKPTPLLLALAAALALACPAPPEAEADASGDPTVVARIGDEAITAGELDAWIKDELFDRETSNGDPAKLHELRAASLENLISKRLLDMAAEARGIEADALLDEEAAKRVAVSDAEIEEFFAANKAQLGHEEYFKVAYGPNDDEDLENHGRPFFWVVYGCHGNYG